VPPTAAVAAGSGSAAACSPAPVEQPDNNQETPEQPSIETISKTTTFEAEIMTYETENQIQSNFEDDVKVTGIIQDEIPSAILEIYGQSCVARQGDKVIGGFVVERIEENEVEISWGEQKFSIYINKEE
jgi:hypothetical protein